MTQTAKTEIRSTAVTAQLLRERDTNEMVVVTPSGQRFGDHGQASITFGLGSWEGDYEGFAHWLATQP